jgi:hypothetical protein
MNTAIRPFPIHFLKLGPSYGLVQIVLEHGLTPQTAESLGIGKPYDDLTALFEKWSEIFRRNPALLQTEELVARIADLRRQMSLLNSQIRAALASEKSTGGTIAHTVSHIARPYLQNIYGQVYGDLLANGRKLTADLEAPGLAAALEELELTSNVTKIDQLSHQVGDLIAERGGEMEFQKQLGSASNMRRQIEKQLHFVLYSILPALYAMNPNSEIALVIKDVSNEINGIFDTYRHLLPASGSDNSGGNLPNYPGDGNGGDGNGSDDNGNDSSEDEDGGNDPDPETPPSGGGDEGSGGPLDRNRLTDRADGAIEIIL